MSRFGGVAATPPTNSWSNGGSVLFDSPRTAVQRSPTQDGTPQMTPLALSPGGRIPATPMTARSSRSSLGSASRRHEIVPAEIAPHETRRFVAQCGASAIVVEAAAERTQLFETEMARDPAGQEFEARALRSFPGLPPLQGRSVLRVSADSRQQSLLIATTRQVIVCHLERGRSGSSSYAPLGRLRGTLVPNESDDAWILKAVGRTSFGGLELTGTMRDGELSGRVHTENGALSGSMQCSKSEHFADVTPTAMGERWTGSCLVTRHGSIPVDLPISFTVTSLEPRAGDSFSVALDVGSIGVELVDAATFKTSSAEIVDAQWHPLVRHHIVVLDSRGTVRVYDLANEMDEPVWSGSVLLGPLRSRTCVAMCFGASPGHTSTHQVASRSVLQLERRLALFVLSDSGAVVSLCPIGRFQPDSPDVKALRTALLEELKHDPSIAETPAWSGPMNWTEAVLRGVAATLSPVPVLHCPAPNTTAGSHGRGGRRGSDGGSSRSSSGMMLNSRACGFVYVPVEGSGAAVILRAWAGGRVDTLLGGMPVRLCVQEAPQSTGADDSDLVDGALRTPHRGGRFLGMTPGRASLDTPTRASPLQNLSSKLRTAYLRSRRGGDADSASELAPQALDFDVDDAEDAGSSAGRGLDDYDSQFEDEGAGAIVLGRSSALQVQSRVEDLKVNSRPPILVACTQLNAASLLSLERDVVRADTVIGKDRKDGGMHLLWVPWLLELGKAHRFDVRAVSQLISRAVPDVRGPFGPASSAVFVEPGVGHLALAVWSGDASGLTRRDVGSELMKLSASLGAVNARTHPNGAGSGPAALLRDARDEELDEDSDHVDAARQLDELKEHFNQQLTRLTAIPRKLQSVKLMSPDTPPALSLAICSWLHELSETLLYGHGKSSATGLMEGIRVGMETLQRMREAQVLTFNAQVQALAEVRKNLESTYVSVQSLKTGQVARLAELQSLLDESFDCLEEQIASMSPRSTPADRQLLRAFDDLETRTLGLGDDMNMCASRIDMLQRSEEVMRAQPNPGDCLRGEKALHGLQELQARTQDLIDRMTQVQEKPQADRMSVLSLQERIWSARERIQSIAATGVFVGAPVTVVAFASDAMDYALDALRTGEVSAVKMDRGLLDRGRQATLRRLMSLDATSCPFALPTPTRGASTAGTIHLILLPESTRVEIEGGCCTFVAAGNGPEDASAQLVEVTLVDLAHDEDAERADLTGIRVCADNAGVEAACLRLGGLARMPATEAVRIVAHA